MVIIYNKKNGLIEFSSNDPEYSFLIGEGYITVGGKKIIVANPDDYERKIINGDAEDILCGLYVFSNDECLPLPELGSQWDFVRKKRDEKLSSSDWTIGQDSPLDDEKKQEWILYRSELRDVTKNFKNPFSIVWPRYPGEVRPEDFF
jgi:hypothetical protein